MGPRKRVKPKDQPPRPQLEEVQADHDLFLQAFEKPTQIYRYLKTRHMISPIFLPRTLTYMKARNSRINKVRNGFSIDTILENVEAKQRKQKQIDSYKSEYMSLAFTGFFDKEETMECDFVEVEVFLLKVCHKKRKDVLTPVVQVSIGKTKVKRNPKQTSSPQAAAISIGSENFSHNNGHSVKSYMLMLKVHYKGQNCSAVIQNSDNSDNDEPHAKRRKNSKVISRVPYEECEFGSELVVYDKNKRCLLTDGDYEISLQDLLVKMSPRKGANWETVVAGKAGGPFDVFNSSPILKFNLTWSDKPITGTVDLPPLLPAEVDVTNMEDCDNLDDEFSALITNSLERSTPKKKRTRVFYHFLYNNNARQQTEAHDDLRCPWCCLNCIELYSLLKHLRLSHARFCFTYQPHPKGARIDVTINERYDGSYVGNPQDLHSHIGFSFCRTGPVRRTPVTHVIVYRPKRSKASLSEFIEAEAEETQCSRQLIQGHNRLYYHTGTNQPILPAEFDDDSEEENDPLWLRQKTINLIDEFTDVNEGEKELMKMWNLHIMRKNLIGDCQLPKACLTFIEEQGEEILRMNITRNFLLHMVNMYDFSLINTDTLMLTMNILHKIKATKCK